MRVLPRFYSFWAINDQLELPRLRSQLDEMKRLGLGGTVWHPRFYAGPAAYLSDDYLKIVSETIEYAKSIDLDFWIYDEDGWPSGTVGGALLKKYPDDVQQWAELKSTKPVNVLTQFEHGGQTWFLARRTGQGVDYFSRDLADHFLEMTYDRYRTGLTPAAFDHVSVFFSDEPEFGLGHAYDSLSKEGAIPWTPKLIEAFKQRTGHDLLGVIPALFFDDVADAPEIRVQFTELLTDLFCENFIQPIDEWCRRYGKRFTAHIKGEEHPLFQTPMVGSAQQVFRHLSMPGIDALERAPSNDFYPRQAVSAARQFGDGRTMVECFGGAGWGTTPDDLLRYLSWLGGNGVTDFVFHLWQYDLSAHAIRDWPASIPNHIGWRDAFPTVLAEAKRQLANDSQIDAIATASTLLVSPHRAVAASYRPAELQGMNIHNAATHADTPAARINTAFMQTVRDLVATRTPFHLADERTLESGSVDHGTLAIGNARYTHIVLPESCRLNDVGHSLIAEFKAAGGVLDQHVATAQLEPIEIKSTDQSGTAYPVEWTLEQTTSNQLLLEPVAEGAGSWSATFQTTRALDVAIISSDPIDIHPHATPPLKTRIGRSVLHFDYNEAAPPFVWLVGRFLVRSVTPYRDGPNDTVCTDGPFELSPINSVVGADLTVEGFPFAAGPIDATTTLVTSRAFQSLTLQGIAADACRLTLDDHDLGFAWGPTWRYDLSVPVSAGIHTIELTLYASAYNTYGPHHHFEGDRHLVSPAQFSGTKNFAEAIDAPDFTLVDRWHFRPLRLPRAILLNNPS